MPTGSFGIGDDSVEHDIQRLRDARQQLQDQQNQILQNTATFHYVTTNNTPQVATTDGGRFRTWDSWSFDEVHVSESGELASNATLLARDRKRS